ncbi:MAG: hypothetical protein PHX93_01900 [Candidatus Peribacteraceae bacterium]|jgi:hypothetical protein|nr:hypothetical protein [Candidatus Peribacteraceae bacterium]
MLIPREKLRIPVYGNATDQKTPKLVLGNDLCPLFLEEFGAKMRRLLLDIEDQPPDTTYADTFDDTTGKATGVLQTKDDLLSVFPYQACQAEWLVEARSDDNADMFITSSAMRPKTRYQYAPWLVARVLRGLGEDRTPVLQHAIANTVAKLMNLMMRGAASLEATGADTQILLRIYDGIRSGGVDAVHAGSEKIPLRDR